MDDKETTARVRMTYIGGGTYSIPQNASVNSSIKSVVSLRKSIVRRMSKC